MSQPKFNQHDIFTLKKDINPEIKSGMVGVILEKYNDTHFLVEFVKPGGTNFEFQGEYMFTIDISYMMEQH